MKQIFYGLLTVIILTMMFGCQSPNLNIGLSDQCDTTISVAKVCK